MVHNSAKTRSDIRLGTGELKFNSGIRRMGSNNRDTLIGRPTILLPTEALWNNERERSFDRRLDGFSSRTEGIFYITMGRFLPSVTV